MLNNIIFEDEFLISGIMCYDKCGTNIEKQLYSALKLCKEKSWLPEDAILKIAPEPYVLGINRIALTIESEHPLAEDSADLINSEFRKHILSINTNFKILSSDETKNTPEKWSVNWFNLLINLAAFGSIIALSIIFPPSLPLTIGLTALTLVATTFTARSYLIQFFKNLKQKTFFNMTSTVSLGWFLSLAHTLYHNIAMPIVHSFSMLFSSFLMPITFMTFVNGMDEIKRIIANKSSKMQLQGLKSLFPQMAEEYTCCLLSLQEQEQIHTYISKPPESDQDIMLPIPNPDNCQPQNKNRLQPGMAILVKRGECFPVDCVLLSGNTMINSALLTGQAQENKNALDSIPGGAINLREDVMVYALKNTYNSTANRILFRSNRARKTEAKKSSNTFAYIYGGLFVIALAASFFVPFAFGIFAIPLVVQNIIGILCVLCPCMIAIAEQLPKLWSVFQRNRKNILLRDDSLTEPTNPKQKLDILFVDFSGTLTTGNSQVSQIDPNIDDSQLQRIYLLEKFHGGDHPIAKSIVNHYESKFSEPIIKVISDVSHDAKNRGLSGTVQGMEMHIGNKEYYNNEYFKERGIVIPQLPDEKLAQSPIYIVEKGQFIGSILFKHEARQNVISALKALQKPKTKTVRFGKKYFTVEVEKGVEIYMITGDTYQSAKAFNDQNGKIFAEDHLITGQTPYSKEEFIKEFIKNENIDPKGIWFVGDGINDAQCARLISENGGVSCSITSDDKASFFTDISLNGSLDYLLEHKKLNNFMYKIAYQNRWLLAFSNIAFLTFLISFSSVGIAVSPVIPFAIMLTTMGLMIFNSYRSKISVDESLEDKKSWPRRFMQSDASLYMLISTLALLGTSVLITTVASGGLALPAIAFTAGAAAAVSSTLLLASLVLFSVFAVIGVAYVISENRKKGVVKEPLETVVQMSEAAPTTSQQSLEETSHYTPLYRKIMDCNVPSIAFPPDRNCNTMS